MQLIEGKRLYSASDLVAFLECEHLTSLDLINLATPLQKSEVDDSGKLVQEKGIQHEREYFQRLRRRFKHVVDVSEGRQSIADKVLATNAAMRAGAEVIYQATLLDGPLLGYADFLLKVEQPSTFGNYSYEVADTKLSRTPKAKFLVQLAFYSRLLKTVQGTSPVSMHLVLGDRSTHSYRCGDYSHYVEYLLERFLSRVVAIRQTIPEPCSYCDLCRWSERCRQQWLDSDHLSQVANITRSQSEKLHAIGIDTMAKLAASSGEVPMLKVGTETVLRLRAQASLQVKARDTGQRALELLPIDSEHRRGFSRLPMPSDGDIYFDMEGNPWEEGGLEYLFGVYCRKDGQWIFVPFWAHDRNQERIAFERFMDFVMQRLIEHPDAHVYHYAKYEESALKKLMSLHGTREAAVDHLLRSGTLVDLYQVVRESLRVSEPGYSIKNIEHFYRGAREGEVTNAGASIVWYERWRETGEQGLLDAIEAYNKDDVYSTQKLHEWLLGLRPASLPWGLAGNAADEAFGDTSADTSADTRSDKLKAAEARLATYRVRLFDPLPTDRGNWSTDDSLRELSFQLLEFHRRADKPAYWALFARRDMTEEELLEDPECLAGLTADPDHPPRLNKRSVAYTYRYPEQETKLRDGSAVTHTDTAKALGDITLDAESRRVTLRVGKTKNALPERLSLGPGSPLNTKVLREALYRFADSVIDDSHRYRAVEALLRRDPPRITGQLQDSALIASGTGKAETLVEAVTDVVARMDQSYLFIQGPPGAGKTYTASHVIVALLKSGKRIGVTSNSHKAIHNLLDAVTKVARAQRFQFRGVKKATENQTESEYGDPFFQNVNKSADAFAVDADLIAGTAWLFCDPVANQALDYLFVDEAGQVALANLVAMGTSARNLVLMGDQMQLSQPLQGIHPGQSGESSLNYLLQGAATVAPDRGVFLETSWRMHPDVCRFISDAVYDSRLKPEAANAKRVLQLSVDAHSLLKPSGIVFAPIEHTGCSQQSPAEAELILTLYRQALLQRYVDRDGRSHDMTPENIMVVAPYNLQVNLLRDLLPLNARVGTVDKFQGQEAELVLISMTTTSEAEMPRNMEFLYSKNRLNVAISRARSLAVVVASPGLLAIRCSTPEQMGLVNTLCWVAKYEVNWENAG
jgi:predicted RecB family nuclease